MAPFQVGTHYKVKIQISNGRESRLHGGEIGRISLSIRSHHESETEKLLTTRKPM